MHITLRPSMANLSMYKVSLVPICLPLKDSHLKQKQWASG